MFQREFTLRRYDLCVGIGILIALYHFYSSIKALSQEILGQAYAILLLSFFFAQDVAF